MLSPCALFAMSLGPPRLCVGRLWSFCHLALEAAHAPLHRRVFFRQCRRIDETLFFSKGQRNRWRRFREIGKLNGSTELFLGLFDDIRIAEFAENAGTALRWWHSGREFHRRSQESRTGLARYVWVHFRCFLTLHVGQNFLQVRRNGDVRNLVQNGLREFRQSWRRRSERASGRWTVSFVFG